MQQVYACAVLARIFVGVMQW